MSKHLEYKQPILLVAGIGTILAGIIHATVVAFAHVAPLPLETIFFVVAGLMQIVIAISAIRTGRLKYSTALFSINGALIVLWILSRTLRAPFMDSPESVDTLGVLVVILQSVSIIAAAFLKWVDRNRIKHVHGYLFAHVFSVLLIVALLSGSGIFAGGRLGEIFLPDRTLNHSHGDEVGHADNGDEHHDDDEMNETGINMKVPAPGHEGEVEEMIVQEDIHDDDPHPHE